MKLSVKNIVQDFTKRGGAAIFIATFFARILSFIASIIALQLIDNTVLGLVIYAFTIVSFIIPLSGLGLHQSLIRYGALLESREQKNSLFIYVLKKGIFWSFILAIIVIILSFIFDPVLLDSKNYLIAFVLLIPASFILEILKVQLRLFHKNIEFAKVEITYAVILLLTVFILSYFYNEIGYIIALICSPLITASLFFNKLNINLQKQQEKLSIINITFWKYGFFSSLSNVATQFLMAIDILLIGYFLSNPEIVTIYKYIALIPLSLLFLPRVFMTTDFVKITENIFDTKDIKEYIKSYSLLFLIRSICVILFSFVFSNYILSYFGESFTRHKPSFMVLIIGVCGILIFRGLFGNLLSAIGKAYANYWISLIAIFLNIFLNYFLIPRYGIFGAAITSASLMWFTGILSTMLFFFYYKGLDLGK